MQMAANPHFYKKQIQQMKYDISFVGQKYADRGSIVAKLINNGFDIKVWGPRWKLSEKIGTATTKDRINKLLTISKKGSIQEALKYFLNKATNSFTKYSENKLIDSVAGGILSDDEIVHVFNTSKINLGFSTVFKNGRDTDDPLQHIRLRDFEIPMSGGFYLPSYVPELEEYFEIDKEIICYYSFDDLVEKLTYYLKNDTEREKIRSLSYRRSLNSHTWSHRFNELFSNNEFLNFLR